MEEEHPPEQPNQGWTESSLVLLGAEAQEVSVPEPWEAIILAAAAWRTFQLLAADDILDTPRRYVTGRLSEYWEDFLTCPYCAGFWIAVAWWGAWLAWEDSTLIAATPWALSAGVIAAAKVLSSE